MEDRPDLPVGGEPAHLDFWISSDIDAVMKAVVTKDFSCATRQSELKKKR